MHAVRSSTSPKLRVWIFLAAMMAALVAPQAQAAATTTTLTLSSSSVTSGTVVTFTAAVSNGSPVTLGTVTFCNATATYCDNSAVIGLAQLTSAGTAVIKLVPGTGSHSYKAVFTATTSNAASTSPAESLTVTAASLFPATTTIASSGSAGDYALTATVVGTGTTVMPLAGSVSFLDSTNSNYVLGSATLGIATLGQSFAAGVTHVAGYNPTGIAVGDFNGDGHPDVVVANDGTDGSESPTYTVSVFLGSASGTFSGGTTYAVGLVPYQVVVGDFNGDGKLDLAVTNSGANTVSVLLGNGDGTFQTQVAYAVGSTPHSLAVGDFNNDGKLDLAVANYGGSTVSILLGTGTGTFATQVTYATGSNTFSVAVSDFNGDGNPDLAVANGSGGTVGVLLGNGDGTFQSQVTYPAGSGADWVAVGDQVGNGGTGPGGATGGGGAGTTGNNGLPNTTTVTTTSAAQITVGDSVTFTATVAPAASTGTVAFFANQNFLGTATIAGGQAQFTTTTLPGGSLSILAGYPGSPSVYNGSQAAALVQIVNKHTPAITWQTPAAIVAGTALSGTQLDATASVPGTFVYNPALGSIPAAGNDTLSVTFTPTNGADYVTVTATVPLTVDGLALALSGSSAQAINAGEAATFTFQVAPVGSTTFLHPVTFSASGLPPGATSTFSPATVAEGSSVTAVNLTIQTSKSSARENTGPQQYRSYRGTPFWLTLLLLPLLGIPSLRKRTRSGWLAPGAAAASTTPLVLGLTMGGATRGFARFKILRLGFAMVALAGIATALGGCPGGGFAGSTTAPNTYVITVTASSGTQQPSTTFTLEVK